MKALAHATPHASFVPMVRLWMLEEQEDDADAAAASVGVPDLMPEPDGHR